MDELLFEPFRSDFMQHGALAALLVGVLCGVVGCFVVIRGMALLADSFAHGVLPGVAVAVMLTPSSASGPGDLAVLIGALAGGLVTAVGTTLILRRSRLREDTATAVMFVFMLALGVVLISRQQNFAVDLTAFLFGDVLGVSGSEIPVTAALVALLLAVVAFNYRRFVLVAFDARRAASLGVPVARTELVLMLVLSLSVVVGFRVVGSLLVLGLLIAPPATAALLTRHLPSMMALSAAIAAISAPVGLLLSWHLDVAAGASIVLVAVGIFVGVLAVRGSRTA
ncbi:MAG TPA: metal ABC transporter permease [Baekduia sp.]|nr:metal ABC transporter permease [Baekduia sp.]